MSKKFFDNCVSIKKSVKLCKELFKKNLGYTKKNISVALTVTLGAYFLMCKGIKHDNKTQYRKE